MFHCIIHEIDFKNFTVDVLMCGICKIYEDGEGKFHHLLHLSAKV